MKFTYQLTNSDFLAYQLFLSSKSELHKKRRLRSRIIIPIIYLVFGLFLAKSNNDIGIAVVLGGVAVLWFSMYPKYSKWRYKRHFEKHIEANNKKQVNKDIEIEFDKNSIKTKDSVSQGEIKGEEIKEIIETQHHFFVKLSTDQSLVVPKYKMENQAEFKKQMIDLGVQHIDELDWEWK